MTRARSRTAIAIASRLSHPNSSHHHTTLLLSASRSLTSRSAHSREASKPTTHLTSPTPEPQRTNGTRRTKKTTHHTTPMANKDAATASAQQRAADLPIEQQPPPLSQMLQDDRRQADDCTPCRVMGAFGPSFCPSSPPTTTINHPLTIHCCNLGASAFIGLGVYSYISGHSQLREQRARQLAEKSLLGLRARKASITGLAGVLVGLGVYRLVN